MEAYVQLPTVDIIDEWKELDQVKLPETAPRSVPLSVFLKVSEEDDYGVTLKEFEAIPAAAHLAKIKMIKEDIKVAENYLLDFYSRRSMTRNLRQPPYQDQITGSPEGKAIAKSIVEKLAELLKKYYDEMTQIANNISRCLMDDSLWDQGQFSDIFFDNICLLIYKLSALEQLASSKKSLSSDISNFSFLSNEAGMSQFQQDVQVVRQFIASPYSITNLILEACKKNLKPQRTQLVVERMYIYIRNRIENNDYLFPEMEDAYGNAYKFFLKLHCQQLAEEKSAHKDDKKYKYIMKPPEDDVKAFMGKIFQVRPSITFIFEFAAANCSNIEPSLYELSPKAKIQNIPKYERVNLKQLIKYCRNNFNILSNFTASFNTLPKRVETKKLEIPIGLSDKIVEFLPRCLIGLSRAISEISFIITHNLLFPPKREEEDKDMSNFELSMRRGLQPDREGTLRDILLLLWIVRSTRELLIQYNAQVTQTIADSIQNTIQEFADTTLSYTILRNSDYKELIVDISENLRTLLGYFEGGKNHQITVTSVKKLPPHVVNTKLAGPNIAIVEIARIQAQLLTNKKAPANTKQGVFKGKPLNTDDCQAIKKFVKDSRYFVDLLRLDETLNKVTDTSSLYFKEFHLDSCATVFFPIASSLPVILTDYAMQHYQNSDLTGAIFYPLSIYDDAARTALNVLKSQLLYREVKAEAEICVQYIMRNISTYAFDPIMKFTALRSMPPSLWKDVEMNIAASPGTNVQRPQAKLTLSENVAAIRIGVILEQTQLSILGVFIDTKSLIAEYINEMLNNKITQLVEIVNKHGVIAMPLFNRIIGILQATHQIFCSFNLPMMTFDDIVRISLALDHPGSLQSRLMTAVAFHLVDFVAPDFYALSAPLRLIPKKTLSVDLTDMLKNVAPIMSCILNPTMSLISTESFKELFWLLDDGAIHVLSEQLTEILPDIFENLVLVYQSAGKRLKRIKNLPMSHTCSQVFERFEGAYRYFLDDSEIDLLFQTMQQIGNVLALSEIMDNAFLMKYTTTQQTAAFMFSQSPVDEAPWPAGGPEIFELYDANFTASRNWFDALAKKAAQNEVSPPFLTAAVRTLSGLVLQKYDLFAEHSGNLCDLQSLDGFAAVWSVLEFIFCLRESRKAPAAEGRPEEIGAIARYGEGIQLCAAAIVATTGQRRLYRALSIGERLVQHSKTDFAQVMDSQVTRFLATNEFSSTSMSSALANYQPIVDRILKR